MGGLHCVPVAAFNRKPKQIYIQVFGSVLEPQKKKIYEQNEWQRGRRTTRTTCYMLYIGGTVATTAVRFPWPPENASLFIVAVVSCTSASPDLPSESSCYQFTRIQNALGPYLDTVQCTRDFSHV